MNEIWQSPYMSNMSNMSFFDIYDKVDIHGIGHMSMMNISIWVSKEASGPQDHSKIPFIKFLNDYSEKFSKY